MTRRRAAALAGVLTIVTLASAMLATGAVVATTPADAAASGSTPRCGSFPALLAAEHAQATRREATLANLVAIVHARHDPFGLNAGQLSTLQVTNSAIQALDQKVATHCYASQTKLLADFVTLYTVYRVYWLRLPQTLVIAAADYLGDARARIHDAATKLAGRVRGNARAGADLRAIHLALAGADAKLGVAPNVAPPIDAVRLLQPATDMTADSAAIDAARVNLIAARAALNTARTAGLRLVADLGG